MTVASSQKLVAGRLVLVLLALLLGFAAAQEVQLEREVFEIGRGLRCPTCDAESVADSNAGVSLEMRQMIREQLQAGSNREEIYAFFTERYGDWILMNPPRRGVHLIVWLLPVLGVLVGVGVVVYYLRTWTAKAEAPIEADPEYLQQVRRELQQGER